MGNGIHSDMLELQFQGTATRAYWLLSSRVVVETPDFGLELKNDSASRTERLMILSCGNATRIYNSMVKPHQPRRCEFGN